MFGGWRHLRGGCDWYQRDGWVFWKVKEGEVKCTVVFTVSSFDFPSCTRSHFISHIFLLVEHSGCYPRCFWHFLTFAFSWNVSKILSKSSCPCFHVLFWTENLHWCVDGSFSRLSQVHANTYEVMRLPGTHLQSYQVCSGSWAFMGSCLLHKPGPVTAGYARKQLKRFF